MESIGLEDALTLFERDAASAVKALSAALREVKKLQAAAAVGDLRALRNGTDASVKLADQASTVVQDLRDGWRFDESTHFESGGFAKEVLAVAESEGLLAFESDERLLSYPVIVQIVSTDASVVIDKVRDRRVRPTVLVRTLKALQQRPPRFKADAFLETLANGYDLVVASESLRSGSVAKILDVYAVLTLMPGSAREYTKQEFARDLYLLDQSGVTTTKSGRTIAFSASALTRSGGALHTVTRNGEPKVYAGVTFASPTA